MRRQPRTQPLRARKVERQHATIAAATTTIAVAAAAAATGWRGVGSDLGCGVGACRGRQSARAGGADARVAAQPERAQRVAARERGGERACPRVADVVVVELDRDHACSSGAETLTRGLPCMAPAGQAPEWA